MTATANANEIRITRLYDAPVDMVWDAWTDLNHVSKWWGPRGFTITTHSKDLSVGGLWVYTMHGPDGKDWPNYTKYHVVEKHRRLEYDHGATAEDAKPLFRVTAEFRDVGGKTELVMSMAFNSPEEAKNSRAFIKAAGGNSTWDRLGEYLEKGSTNKDVFIINRSFNTSIDTLFDLWTKPEHFAKWLPPTGFTMSFKHVDIRSGGEGSFSMTNGQFTMHGRVNYLDVHRPDRIVYTQCFTDADGNLSRHPGAPVWPDQLLMTVTLTAEGESETRVTIHTEVYGKATSDEVAAFVAERPGMTQGWTGSFDKLEELIDAI